MFPEIGGTEILLIAIVALIVVGPKDLPVMLRKLGQFMAKLRGMAADFRASFDEMARQSELDELRKEVEAMRRGEWADTGGTQAAVSETFAEINSGLNEVGVDLNAPTNYRYDEAAATELEPPVTPEAAPVKKPRARKKTTVSIAEPEAPAAAAAKRTPAKRKPRAKPATEQGS